MNVELVLDTKATLGEGPVWDNREQLLYWVDIMAYRLYRYHPHDGTIDCFQFDRYIGAVAIRQSGGLLLAMQHGFYSFNETIQQPIPICELETHLDNRFNDGKCDSLGRFWSGSLSMAHIVDDGAFYRLDTNHSVHRMISGIGISNGLGWNADNTIMYYIDSLTHCVDAFDFDLEKGEIRNRRIVYEVPKSQGVPDGMTVDEEGMLWVAIAGGYEVARINPRTGKKIESIPLPVSIVTSCEFGGVNGNELYITSGRMGLSESQIALEPLAGGLFKVKLDVRGGNIYPFKG